MSMIIITPYLDKNQCVVDMERLKRKELPPKEWFEKAIKRCKDNLGYLKSSIERTEETIKTYENLLS